MPSGSSASFVMGVISVGHASSVANGHRPFQRTRGGATVASRAAAVMNLRQPPTEPVAPSPLPASLQ